MIVTSFNVNGLSSNLHKVKGLTSYSTIICLQETKSKNLPELPDYKGILDPSTERPGLDGTAIYWKKNLKVKRTGHSNGKGRLSFIELDDLVVINVYVPSAGDNLQFMENKLDFLEQLPDFGDKALYCGDFNVALTPKDIEAKDKKSAEKRKGFTPEERQALTSMVSRLGLVDVFRTLEPINSGFTYSNPRFANTHKRIDYFLAKPKVFSEIECIKTMGDDTDHLPLVMRFHSVHSRLAEVKKQDDKFVIFGPYIRATRTGGITQKALVYVYDSDPKEVKSRCPDLDAEFVSTVTPPDFTVNSIYHIVGSSVRSSTPTAFMDRATRTLVPLYNALSTPESFVDMCRMLSTEGFSASPELLNKAKTVRYSVSPPTLDFVPNDQSKQLLAGAGLIL